MEQNDFQAAQIRDEDLSPEDLKRRKAAEEYQAYRNSFDNSWEKNHKSGFDGSFKRREPSSIQDWSKIWIDYLDWDFHLIINGNYVPYQVIRIDGYYHDFDNNFYCYDRKYEHNVEEFKNHLIPWNKKWEACPWSFEVRPIANYRIKWDEYRTNFGYFGTLFRAGVPYGNCSGYTELDVISGLIQRRNVFSGHPLNLHSIAWDKKCVGRPLKIQGKLYKITQVSVGYGEPMIHVSDENGNSFGTLISDNIDIDWYPKES